MLHLTGRHQFRGHVLCRNVVRRVVGTLPYHERACRVGGNGATQQNAYPFEALLDSDPPAIVLLTHLRPSGEVTVPPPAIGRATVGTVVRAQVPVQPQVPAQPRPARHARLSYAPGLDGVRALAVTAVILYHLGTTGVTI